MRHERTRSIIHNNNGYSSYSFYYYLYSSLVLRGIINKLVLVHKVISIVRS